MDAKLPVINKNIHTSLNDNLDLTMIVVHEKIMMIWWFYTTIYNTINWPLSKYIHQNQLFHFGSFEWKIGYHDYFE
jgi:IS30 family transposase